MERTPDEIKKGLECCADKDMQWKNCEQCSYGCFGGCSNLLHEDALAYIQQLEEQVPRWISVKEPPKQKGDYPDTVNVYTENGEVLVGFYNRGKWFVMASEEDYCEEVYEGTVTHWMPLPEGPKEG